MSAAPGISEADEGQADAGGLSMNETCETILSPGSNVNT
jgi:hypothetical protein